MEMLIAIYLRGPTGISFISSNERVASLGSTLVKAALAAIATAAAVVLRDTIELRLRRIFPALLHFPLGLSNIPVDRSRTLIVCFHHCNVNEANNSLVIDTLIRIDIRV